MKKNVLLIVLISLLGFSSCQQDDDIDLSVSESSLDLPKAASENRISITTNSDSWNAFSNVEWISTEEENEELIVTVTENNTTQDRIGKVVVIAGEMTQTIDIHQAASDVTIVTLPDQLDIDQWGGTYQFDVDANTQDWAISSDVDWVKLTPKQFKGEVVVEVAENTERLSRVATLSLTGGSTVKQFLIKQDGIMFFIFPCLDFGSDGIAIKNFELARRSDLVKQPDGLFNADQWMYQTKSKAFDVITYQIPAAGLAKVILFAANQDILTTELDNYKTFLLDNGYTEKTTNVFVNPEKNTEAAIHPEAQDPQIIFSFVPTQPQAYPTFSAFPYGFENFNGLEADVRAYEAANNGTFNDTKSSIDPAEESNFLFFDVANSEAVARAYFINNADPKVVSETAQYFKDWSKGFFQSNGQYYVTNEFSALLEKEGFEFSNPYKDWLVYKNAAKKLTMVVRVAKYTDFDYPVLDLHIFQTSEASSASVWFERRAKKSLKTEKITLSRYGRFLK